MLGICRSTNRANGSCCTQSICLSMLFFSTLLNVPCRRSNAPLVCGWYGEIFTWLTPMNVVNSFMRLDINWGPWSLSIWSGIVVLAKIDQSASVTARPIAKGKRGMRVRPHQHLPGHQMAQCSSPEVYNCQSQSSPYCLAIWWPGRRW